MNRSVGPFGPIPKLVIPPDLMPSLEDVFCLLLIFFFDKLIYPLFSRCGIHLHPLRRIGIGFFFIAISFSLAGFIQLWMNSLPEGELLSVAWQIPQIWFMACAEITVAISGLDFVYSQSPERSRNVVNAIWSLTSAVGNLLVVVISLLEIDNQASLFFIFSGMMFLNLLFFIALSRGYHYVQQTEVGVKI
jgi:POT family proton-dependent oligopeptide transporter